MEHFLYGNIEIAPDLAARFLRRDGGVGRIKEDGSLRLVIASHTPEQGADAVRALRLLASEAVSLAADLETFQAAYWRATEEAQRLVAHEDTIGNPLEFLLANQREGVN